MRAILIKSFGNPEDVVHLGEAKIPEAAKGELRIKLLKSPIHNHDLAIIRGTYGYKPELQRTSVGGGQYWKVINCEIRNSGMGGLSADSNSLYTLIMTGMCNFL